MEGFDGGFSGIMLAACWNVPGGLCRRRSFSCSLKCASLTLRGTFGKLLRKFCPLVEGNGIETEQKGFVVSARRGTCSSVAVLVLGRAVCSNRPCS